MLLIFPVPVGICKCFVHDSDRGGGGFEKHHSGILHCVIWYILFDVMKDCSVPVLDCLTLRMTALLSFKTSGNAVKPGLSSAG